MLSALLSRLDRALAVALVAVLRVYRLLVSPLYGEVCRYYPSCSQYALTAVQTRGTARGTVLAVRRLARCHPWAAGGVDHVPPAPTAASTQPAKA